MEKKINFLCKVCFRLEFKLFLLLYYFQVKSYLTRFFFPSLLPSLPFETTFPSSTFIWGYLHSLLWTSQQCTVLKLTQSEWPLFLDSYVFFFDKELVSESTYSRLLVRNLCRFSGIIRTLKSMPNYLVILFWCLFLLIRLPFCGKLPLLVLATTVLFSLLIVHIYHERDLNDQ